MAALARPSNGFVFVVKLPSGCRVLALRDEKEASSVRPSATESEKGGDERG
jgi:hypothetical protein